MSTRKTSETSHETSFYWRSRGQVEGLEMAAEMLTADIEGCSDGQCDACQSLRHHEQAMKAHARRFRKELPPEPQAHTPHPVGTPKPDGATVQTPEQQARDVVNRWCEDLDLSGNPELYGRLEQIVFTALHAARPRRWGTMSSEVELTAEQRAEAIYRKTANHYGPDLSRYGQHMIAQFAAAIIAAEQRGRVEGEASMQARCEQICIAKRKTATVVMSDDAYDAVWEIEHQIRTLAATLPPDRPQVGVETPLTEGKHL